MKRMMIASIAAVLMPALALTSTAEASGRGIGLGIGLGLMTGMMLNQAAEARRERAVRENYMIRDQMRRERSLELRRARANQQKRQQALEMRTRAAEQRKQAAVREQAAKRRALLAKQSKPATAPRVAAHTRDDGKTATGITTSSIERPITQQETKVVPVTTSQPDAPRNCSRYIPQSGVTIDVPC